MELELRIALLLLGLAAIAALYFFGKSKRAVLKREDEEFNFETAAIADPLELDEALELGDDLLDEPDADVNDELGDIGNLVREDAVESPRIALSKNKSSFSHQPSLLDEEPHAPKAEEKLVVLHVMAKRPQKFTGINILGLIKELELELDEMNIYSKNVERFSGKRALYSMVNMVKPGTFSADAMHGFETPGLSFILNLPGPEEGLRAFNIMLEDARKFAERLNGELLDESRNRLNPQMTSHLQEDIQLFSLRYPRSASV